MEEKEYKLKGIITLEDLQAREMLEVLNTQIQTMNERTKAHTIYIKQLEKKVKVLEKEVLK